MINLEVYIPEPYPEQDSFVYDVIKRKVIRVGRRGGKTFGAAMIAVEGLMAHRRVLYAVPTSDQKEQFWYQVKRFMQQPIEAGIYRKNETESFIELPGTRERIKAKTAWNADSLRGDFADLLILDEFQLMNEDTWGVVGAPMLLDNDGDAVFIYTPPSLHSRSASKARDKQHAAKLFKAAKFEEEKAKEKGEVPRWKTYTFSSHVNPHISKIALAEISKDMTRVAYRQEIMAEDIDEAPGALWTRKIIEDGRVLKKPKELSRIVVAVDPSTTATGDETGIIVCAKEGKEYYVIADRTVQGSPDKWARETISAYNIYEADRIVAEKNQGGEMVSLTIRTVEADVPIKLVHASRGKAVRAEPISALYEQGKVHHIGNFPELEDELCLWMPGDKSPNRLDALVWGISELKRPSGADLFGWAIEPKKETPEEIKEGEED